MHITMWKVHSFSDGYLTRDVMRFGLGHSSHRQSPHPSVEINCLMPTLLRLRTISLILMSTQAVSAHLADERVPPSLCDEAAATRCIEPPRFAFPDIPSSMSVKQVATQLLSRRPPPSEGSSPHNQSTSESVGPAASPAGPVRRLTFPSPYRIVSNASPAHVTRLEQVASVDHHPLAKFSPEPAQVRRAERVPFGADDQSIGPHHRIIPAVRKAQVLSMSVDAFSLTHRRRVKRLHSRPCRPQCLQQRPAWRFAHVVRIGLECQSPHRNSLSPQIAAQRTASASRIASSLSEVHGLHRAQKPMPRTPSVQQFE